MKKRYSIKIRISLILLICFIVPFLLQVFQVNIRTNHMVRDKIFKTIYKTFENSALHTSSVIQAQYDMAWYYKKDPMVQEVAENFEKLDQKQLASLQGQIRNRIINENNFDRFSNPFNYIIMDYHGNIMTNWTYSPNAEYQEVYAKLSSTDWFQTLENSYVDFSVMFSDENYFHSSGAPQFYVATTIFSDDNTGVFIIGVDQKTLTAQLSDLLDGSNFIVANNGTLIAASADSEISYSGELYSEAMESKQSDDLDLVITTIGDRHEKYVVMAKDMFIKGYYTDWRLLSVVPYDSVASDLNSINATSIIVLIFYVIAIILVVAWLNRDIARPIIRLADLVGEVADGDLNAKAENLPNNEIGELGRGFNNMVKQIERYFRELREREELKRKTDLRLLQNQIKPHFVRNVLNTIRWLAEINGVPSVSKSIMALLSLLEYNFRDTKMMSRLSDEINYVQKYIYLQKLRFQNKFKDEYELDENIMHLPVLKLSFQPIVENCIHHGLLNKEGLGTIVIRGKREGQVLKFTISDDGVGIAPEELEKILITPDQDEIVEVTENTENIALWNINLRMKKQYGDEYGLRVESVLGEGTKVTVLFPVQEDMMDGD